MSEGADATFECELSKPDKKITWMRNGKELKPGKDFTMETDGCVHRLVLKNCKLADKGPITAKVEDVESTANLFVEGKPRKICTKFNVINH